MSRRSSRGSVYNKRSNERVQAAQTSGSSSSSSGGGGIIPHAHAQSSNPTQNQSPQTRTQSTQFDPLARVGQFVHNVGRGAYDTGRSYYDIADTVHAGVTGREIEQRSYRDESLATVLGRGLFEGDLEGSLAEASRRVQEQPGRVVGEIAAETAIMLGTMGFGAVAKGVKIGATGIRSATKGVKTYESATGFGGANLLDTTKLTLRAGRQQKTIGNKVTTTKSRRGDGKWKTVQKKTTVFDKLERAGTTIGDRQGQFIRKVSPRFANKLNLGRAVGEGTDIPLVAGGTFNDVVPIAKGIFTPITQTKMQKLPFQKLQVANIVKNRSEEALSRAGELPESTARVTEDTPMLWYNVQTKSPVHSAGVDPSKEFTEASINRSMFTQTNYTPMKQGDGYSNVDVVKIKQDNDAIADSLITSLDTYQQGRVSNMALHSSVIKEAEKLGVKPTTVAYRKIKEGAVTDAEQIGGMSDIDADILLGRSNWIFSDTGKAFGRRQIVKSNEEEVETAFSLVETAPGRFRSKKLLKVGLKDEGRPEIAVFQDYLPNPNLDVTYITNTKSFTPLQKNVWNKIVREAIKNKDIPGYKLTSKYAKKIEGTSIDEIGIPRQRFSDLTYSMNQKYGRNWTENKDAQKELLKEVKINTTWDPTKIISKPVVQTDKKVKYLNVFDLQRRANKRKVKNERITNQQKLRNSLLNQGYDEAYVKTQIKKDPKKYGKYIQLAPRKSDGTVKYQKATTTDLVNFSESNKIIEAPKTRLKKQVKPKNTWAYSTYLPRRPEIMTMGEDLAKIAPVKQGITKSTVYNPPTIKKMRLRTFGSDKGTKPAEDGTKNWYQNYFSNTSNYPASKIALNKGRENRPNWLPDEDNRDIISGVMRDLQGIQRTQNQIRSEFIAFDSRRTPGKR